MENINFKQIIEKEKDMLLEAETKYGSHFKNALDFVALAQDFIKQAKPKAWIFSLFLSQFRKHLVLSFFSALRLHHIQAMLDLRVVMESGANAAYAIASSHQDDFVITLPDGTLDAPRGLSDKRYRWLEEKYPKGSEAIKNLKGIINRTSAHSNLIYAFSNWEFVKEERVFKFSYFDKEVDKLVKTDLWQIGNVAMGLMDLFYGVNLDHKTLIFSEDFVPRLKKYEATNNALKQEILQMPKISLKDA